MCFPECTYDDLKHNVLYLQENIEVQTLKVVKLKTSTKIKKITVHKIFLEKSDFQHNVIIALKKNLNNRLFF